MVTHAGRGERITSLGAAEVAQACSSHVARLLRASISRSGVATLALAAGSTPRGTYVLLSRMPGIDWAAVHLFWVDERAVPVTDERSAYRSAMSALEVPVAPRNVHRMCADAPDLAAAARDYERTVRAIVASDEDGVPAFDVLLLGIGDDGHTASLFPGDPAVEVRDRLVCAVAGGSNREPRMTLTAPAIEHARNVLVLAVGSAKRAALERVWREEGHVHETPARVVRRCRGKVTWHVDAAAAGERGRDPEARDG